MVFTRLEISLLKYTSPSVVHTYILIVLYVVPLEKLLPEGSLVHTEERPVLGGSINNYLQAHTLNCPMTACTVGYNCSADRLDVVNCQTGYSSRMQMLLTLTMSWRTWIATALVQESVLQCFPGVRNQ